MDRYVIRDADGNPCTSFDNLDEALEQFDSYDNDGLLNKGDEIYDTVEKCSVYVFNGIYCDWVI